VPARERDGGLGLAPVERERLLAQHRLAGGQRQLIESMCVGCGVPM